MTGATVLPRADPHLPLPKASIEDCEMRHGRKSKSKRIDGYKRHIARDMDGDAIVA